MAIDIQTAMQPDAAGCSSMQLMPPKKSGCQPVTASFLCCPLAFGVASALPTGYRVRLNRARFRAYVLIRTPFGPDSSTC